MKRLGKFSGKIYAENEVKNMKECGVMLSDSKINNEEFIAKLHIENLRDCVTCMGCPLAQRCVV
jgi:hypothetical protein